MARRRCRKGTKPALALGYCLGMRVSPLTSLLAQVIVTSYLFPGAKFDEDRLRRLAEKVGKERLVVDVRCG